MILVTAAHGNQGKLLVPKLLAAGQLVRACVRSQASAEQLRGLGVQEIVVGDISEPAVLARAIRGVQKVYHVGPTIHPRERDMGLAVVDAARAEGLPGAVIPGIMSQAQLAAMIHRWAPGCFILRIDTVFRTPMVVGTPVVCQGAVTGMSSPRVKRRRAAPR